MKAHKIVASYQLESATLDGWELVRSISITRMEKMSCTTPIATPGNTNYNTPGVTTMMRDEVMRVNEPVFLLSKDTEIVNREAMLQMELQATKEQIAPLKLKSDNDDKDLKQLREAHDAAQTRLRDVSQEVLDARTKIRQLEGDLARLRTAIGTVRFDEILAK